MVNNDVEVFEGYGFSDHQIRDIAAVKEQIKQGSPPHFDVENWVFPVNSGRRVVLFRNPEDPAAIKNYKFIPRDIREYVNLLRYGRK